MNRNIILFKNNLRINDNPLLKEGGENSYILPIYIHDESHEVNTSGPPYPGMIKMAKLMAAKGKSIINQSAKELHELEPRLNTTKYCKNQTGPIVKDFHPGI